jgi:hypothetical protein
MSLCTRFFGAIGPDTSECADVLAAVNRDTGISPIRPSAHHRGILFAGAEVDIFRLVGKPVPQRYPRRAGRYGDHDKMQKILCSRFTNDPPRGYRNPDLFCLRSSPCG